MSIMMAGMVKLIAVVRRRPDVELAEFYRIWQYDLPPLVERLPGLRGYQQNHAVPRAKGWPWDGAAELWFDDRQAVRDALNSPEAATLLAVERTFIGTTESFIADERPIFLPRRLAR